MAILSADKRDVQINGDFKTSGFKIQASAKHLRFYPVISILTKFVQLFANTTVMRMMLMLLLVTQNLGMFTYLLVLNLTSQFVIMGLDYRTSKFVKYLLLIFILLKLVVMILLVR